MSSVIISNTTWFLRVRLCFDLYCNSIAFLLKCTDKIFDAISSLFLLCFPIISLRWKIYVFPIVIVYELFYFAYSFRMTTYFLMIKSNSYGIHETIVTIIFIISRINSRFFIRYPSHLGVSVYVPPLIRSTWLNLRSKKMT